MKLTKISSPSLIESTLSKIAQQQPAQAQQQQAPAQQQQAPAQQQGQQDPKQIAQAVTNLFHKLALDPIGQSRSAAQDGLDYYRATFTLTNTKENRLELIVGITSHKDNSFSFDTQYIDRITKQYYHGVQSNKFNSLDELAPALQSTVSEVRKEYNPMAK